VQSTKVLNNEQILLIGLVGDGNRMIVWY
jgi:hypothetical protein